jgi:hypothetical protein
MASVNYYDLGEVFTLLELHEVIKGVDFRQFDPDDEGDVGRLVTEYIKPAFMRATGESKELIRLGIAYYTTVGSAPFQLLKDRCQELSLPDADSWPRFFARVGTLLFGHDVRTDFDPRSVTERVREKVVESPFHTICQPADEQ